MATNQTQDYWYVEVRGKNLGRMSIVKVVDLLMAGDLKVIHRVSKDGKTWSALCNEPRFEKYITEVLQDITGETFDINSDDIEPKKPSDSEIVLDIDEVQKDVSSQLAQARALQEMGLKISGLRRILNEIKINKKIVVELKEPSTDTLHPDDQDLLEREKSSGLFGLRRLGTLLFVGLVGSLGYSLVNMYMQERERRDMLVRQSQEKQEAWRRLMAQYDSLFASVGVRVPATADVESLPKQGLMDKLEKFAHPEVKKDEAESVNPSKGIKDSTAAYIAGHNLAIEQLLAGQYQNSEDILLKTIKLPYADKGSAILALYEAAYRLDKYRANPQQELNLERLRRVKPLLEKEAESELADQVLLAQISVAHALNDSDHFKKLTDKFITLKPKAEVNVGSESGLNYAAARWDRIYTWCTDIFEGDNTSAANNALMAACLVRAGLKDKASIYSEFALKSNPQVAPYVGLAAYIRLASGNLDGAKRALAEAPKSFAEQSQYFAEALNQMCSRDPGFVHCEKPKKTVTQSLPKKKASSSRRPTSQSK